MKYVKNMDYEVVLTELAETHIRNIIRYIAFELGNEQAAQSVLEDMEDSVISLSRVAGSIKLCDNVRLGREGYRIFHFKKHRYLMLYKIIGNMARVDGIYHDLQDYGNILR